KVRAGYLTLARNDPDRFEVVDASQNERQVRERIMHILDEKIAQ
nr:dTMP kinase [Deltaproteobacteria bacterium]